MLFKGEEGLKPTDALSGGEAVRLIFAKLMLTQNNVLVLDEPTNHLDLESINALNVALQNSRDGAARHARPGPDGRSRHAGLALQQRRHHGFQGNVRRIRGNTRVASAEMPPTKKDTITLIFAS